MKRLFFIVSVFTLGQTHIAWAQPSEAETTYLDLIFGHCFENVAGKALGERVPNAGDWSRVDDFEVSENQMEDARGQVDLRFKQVGDAELMVDLKNQEVCWTQITGVQAETMAARVRLFVIDGQFGGTVLEERTERMESGQLSRVSVFGLSGWDETDFPVIIVREMLEPRRKALTVQVLMGAKTKE